MKSTSLGVEPERAEDLRLLELRLGVPGAVDPPEHVDPARVGDGGETELLDVLPVLLVAGPGEVLGPDVGVEPVRERVVDGLDVAARSARGLEHRDVVAALHQLVGAAEPADARAGHDDALRRPACRTYRRGGFVCCETCEDSRGGKPERVAPMQALEWGIVRRSGRVGFSHRGDLRPRFYQACRPIQPAVGRLFPLLKWAGYVPHGGSGSDRVGNPENALLRRMIANASEPILVGLHDGCRSLGPIRVTAS